MLIDDAAERLGIARMRVYKLIRKGDLPAKQACFVAPWVIREKDVERLLEIGPPITQDLPRLPLYRKNYFMMEQQHSEVVTMSPDRAGR